MTRRSASPNSRKSKPGFVRGFVDGGEYEREALFPQREPTSLIEQRRYVLAYAESKKYDPSMTKRAFVRERGIKPGTFKQWVTQALAGGVVTQGQVLAFPTDFELIDALRRGHPAAATSSSIVTIEICTGFPRQSEGSVASTTLVADFKSAGVQIRLSRLRRSG